MEKAIEISSEAKALVEVKEGKVILSAKYDGKQADAEVKVAIEVDILIDALVAKTDNKIDDAVAQVLKAALKMV